MKARIAGIACVTPLGATPKEVWESVSIGQSVDPAPMANPETGRNHVGASVPSRLTAEVSRESRLRRSSAISLFAATAAKRAMENSGIAWTPEMKSRLAVVFGVSSGGVQYTRRFYEQVIKQGANVASPMLFPETVYNAPASHVAAMLQVDGATYTLVGDGTVGLQALAFGAELLAIGDADYVLVVAAEELDWILLEAHRDWRLTTDGKCPGALLAEGAAAVLLTRDQGALNVDVSAGHSFVGRKEAQSAMSDAIAEVATGKPMDLFLSGGNGTWVDGVIEAAAREKCPEVSSVISPKKQLGESLGSGALLQVVLAAEGLTSGESRQALVAALGWNQQAAAAVVGR